MASLAEMLQVVEREGYEGANANAKLCQDIVLDAIARCALNRNVTIKGGVVMRGITGDARRATRDIDLDFIRYSLSDDSIDRFILALDDASDFRIYRTGDIVELRHQDYQGKQVFVLIEDDAGTQIQSKIDLGVHRHLDIEQEEYCFDIAYNEDGACLLINSKEQMFVEKLRSLLKFGRFSTRYKDIFDMYYLRDKMSSAKLDSCIDSLIIRDPNMRENDIGAIQSRAINVLRNNSFQEALKTSKKNWLEITIDDVISGLISFFERLYFF